MFQHLQQTEAVCLHVVASAFHVRERLLSLQSLLPTRMEVHDSSSYLSLELPSSPEVLLISDEAAVALDLLNACSAARPGAPVILLVAEPRPSFVVAAMRAGAFDVIAEDVPDVELLASMTKALLESGSLQSQQNSAKLLAQLTRREREVLEQVVKGRTSKQIARALGASPKTVETHRAHILQKLGVHSTIEAIKIALAAASTFAPDFSS